MTDADGVIAQGAYMTITRDTTQTRTIDQRGSPDDFFNICITENLPIYSMNGGDLACDDTTDGVTTTTRPGGWPGPPPPPTIGRVEALSLMHGAIGAISIGPPGRVTMRPCSHISRLMWGCEANWRDRTFRYHGTLWVSEKDPSASSYSYWYDLWRTRLRCARNCTRHITN